MHTKTLSIGIIGMLLAILGFYAIGPAIVAGTALIESGVQFIVSKSLLPLVSVLDRKSVV